MLLARSPIFGAGTNFDRPAVHFGSGSFDESAVEGFEEEVAMEVKARLDGDLDAGEVYWIHLEEGAKRIVLGLDENQDLRPEVFGQGAAGGGGK